MHLGGIFRIGECIKGIFHTICNNITYGSNISLSNKKVDIGEQK